jgi:hypothetical protein
VSAAVSRLAACLLSYQKQVSIPKPLRPNIQNFVVVVVAVVMGRNCSVGKATRYGLDGPGIESWWEGEIFRTRPDRAWGPPSLLYKGYRVSPGGKAAGAWR